MNTSKKLWIGLAVLVLLSPLGLILPARFDSGSAWGEWSAEELNKLAGYLPAGMSRLADLWNAPRPVAALQGQENAALHSVSASYLLAGVLGVGAVVVITLLVGKVIARREH